MNNGTELCRRIVESHGGKTGEALVVSMLTRTNPMLAGKYVGHGGKTGEALAEEMSACAAG